ncbi:hypothetical protein A8U91_02543 [Halomonas elongata]|uniref:NADP transhydrogenase beta-like domain-containing protein n=1 Tax=Halomonas elongata TaxID=2746 RepID=A0A1B8P7D0_HALEL|nr:hypothetical protein A8U91_02543 [Halomonas elongata]
MPQMVALLNGFGGGASLAWRCKLPVDGRCTGIISLLAIGLTVLIGAVTLTGSAVAFGKTARTVVRPCHGFSRHHAVQRHSPGPGRDNRGHPGRWPWWSRPAARADRHLPGARRDAGPSHRRRRHARRHCPAQRLLRHRRRRCRLHHGQHGTDRLWRLGRSLWADPDSHHVRGHESFPDRRTVRFLVRRKDESMDADEVYAAR